MNLYAWVPEVLWELRTEGLSGKPRHGFAERHCYPLVTDDGHFHVHFSSLSLLQPFSSQLSNLSESSACFMFGTVPLCVADVK